MKNLLTTTLAALLLALLLTSNAQAERAVIYGTLTIISDHFVVKTSQPVETENEFADELTLVSSNKLQIIGYPSEEVLQLRALLGKKVQMDGELFAAHTRYHIEPLVLDISEGDFMERE